MELASFRPAQVLKYFMLLLSNQTRTFGPKFLVLMLHGKPLERGRRKSPQLLGGCFCFCRGEDRDVCVPKALRDWGSRKTKRPINKRRNPQTRHKKKKNQWWQWYVVSRVYYQQRKERTFAHCSAIPVVLADGDKKIQANLSRSHASALPFCHGSLGSQDPRHISPVHARKSTGDRPNPMDHTAQPSKSTRPMCCLWLPSLGKWLSRLVKMMGKLIRSTNQIAL